MIQVKMFRDEERGRRLYGAILCCDWCKRQITDLGLALYKWQDDEQGIPLPGTFILLHKGECDEAHNQLHNANRWPWNEATALLGFLINNSQGQSELSQPLWPLIVGRSCPTAQLEGVRHVAESILNNPENRPPRVNDLAF